MGIPAVRGAPEQTPRDKVVHPLMAGVTNPEVVPKSRKNPVYPERWRSSHLSARVILQAEIDKWGIARNIETLKTEVQVEGDCGKNTGDDEKKKSPDPQAPPEASRDFESAALAAVKQWKFRPGTMNGVPVAVFHTLVIEFSPCPAGKGSQSQPAR